MNDRIDVLENLLDSINQFDYMLAELSSFDALCVSLTQMLNDTTKWSGENHDKCVELHFLISEYKNCLLPICHNFRNSLQGLYDSANNFASESDLVSCIRRIQ